MGYCTTTLEFPLNWHGEGKSRPIPPPPVGESISSGPSLSPTDRGQGSIQFSVYDQKAYCAWMTAHPEVDGASTGQILPDAVAFIWPTGVLSANWTLGSCGRRAGPTSCLCVIRWE